ncbi:PE family protein [Marinobacterium zhoushanense]|uniref:PE family protein n=1 Tax=Marinobacterium zhoushanense TaxID=1679163 RepID=A0ABQ1KBB0_9GAMM|nr:hypothetical protein [Marinobacterium zhoushanense]GGB93572.1 PE family protein [Marinobacterium zhoushanense]
MTTSTWNTQPESGDWNTAANWTPTGEPTQSAAFGSSSQTAISFSATSNARIEAIEFTEDASAYTFTFGPCTTPALTIAGAGVSNRSGQQQSFIVASTSSGFRNPQLQFINSASAGGNDTYYCAGPESEQGYGGGVICFHDKATAGSAWFKVWTGAGAPPEHNTVGGEVAFCDSSSADNASFTIYGSLGADGDTFGNVVFHDSATAANASFTNVGGTVSGGDGGNTQFYGNSTAAYGVYNNWGGTHAKANGGDVAFDATATGGQGRFHNFAAPVAGAYGGVTSFNNNPPHMNTQGATAGNGTYINYGARQGEQGGGGHLEFSARYGSPTGANACIVNYGSAIASKSSAGHTIFSINLPTEYFPTAGNASIWNHPAEGAEAAAGFTEFSVYGKGCAGSNLPTAGDAVLFNLGGYSDRAAGGYTVFSGASTAGNARLIAYGGTNGGYGGKIAFYDEASGGTASVQLLGNGELDIGNHNGGLTIGELDLSGGILSVQLGGEATGLNVSGALSINASRVVFSFWKKQGGGFAFNTPYTLLTNANLSSFSAAQFAGNSLDGVEPTFAIVGDALQVSFLQS